MNSRLLFSSVSLIVVAAGAAAAQPAPDPAGAPQLEEVVVTAQRRSETLQRTALAVSAVSGEALQEKGVSAPEDLTKLVPALKISGAAGGGAQVTIRGVGSFAGNAFAEQGVALNYDGVYLARPAGANGLFYDLERVEVLKGPQGTLYGRNATAGAVNIITRKPTQEFGGEIGLELGDYDRVRATMAVNIPLADTVALRIAGQSAKRDGYLTDGYSDEDSDSVRAQLRLQPTEALSVLLAADYEHGGGKGQAGVFSPYVDPGNPYLGPTSPQSNAVLSRTGQPLPPFTDAGFVDQAGWGVSAQLEYKTDFATLTVLPAYRKLDLDYLHYAAGYPVADNQDSDQVSVEARLASGAEGPLKWLIGGYYFDENLSTAVFPNQGVTYSRANIPDIQTTSKAAFGQLTWSATDALRLTGGLRYTAEHKTVQGSVTTPLPAVPTGFPGPAVAFYGVACPSPAAFDLAQLTCQSPVKGDATYEKVTWKAGLEFDLRPNSLLYASAGTGFKAGGFYPSLAPNTFEPELLTAYTIGSKNRFMDNRLQVNAELFYWLYDDKQVTHLGPVRPTGYNLITENAGKAVVYGLDLDVTWLVTGNDRLTAQIQYQESEYDRFVYSLVSPSGSLPATNCGLQRTGTDAAGSAVFSVDCSGRELALAPRWVVNLGYQHTFDLANGATVVGGVSTRIESSYYTAEEYLAGQFQKQSMVSDAELSYRAAGDAWSVTGFIQNIEDEAVKQNSFTQPVLGIPVVTLRAPRTYGVRLNAKF